MGISYAKGGGGGGPSITQMLAALLSRSNIWNAGQFMTNHDIGVVNAGAIIADLALSNVQKVTVGGNVSVNLINWPATGIFGEILIQMYNGGSGVITWPTVQWMVPGTDQIFTSANFAAYLTALGRSPAVLKASGLDMIHFWSADGGATIYGRVI